MNSNLVCKDSKTKKNTPEILKTAKTPKFLEVCKYYRYTLQSEALQYTGMWGFQTWTDRQFLDIAIYRLIGLEADAVKKGCSETMSCGGGVMKMWWKGV